MLIQGDSALIPLLDKSIHCVTTSPPYWGLRKYQGEQGRIWGGDSDCVHEWVERKYYTMRGASSQSSEAFSEAGESNAERLKAARWMNDLICEKCNAWYGGLGLEPTPQQHIQNIVEIFAEVHRVLRNDGVVWLNYGDCYAGSGGENANTGLTAGYHKYRMTDDKTRSNLYRNNPRKEKLPAGNLMLMPHRIAIALQDWGWIVRNDVVWFKRNPMPESQAGWRWSFDSISAQEKRNEERIKNDKPPKPILDGVHPKAPQNVGAELYDVFVAQHGEGGLVTLNEGSWRHTRAHEYVFMLTKKKNYYWDMDAVRVPQKASSKLRAMRGWNGDTKRDYVSGPQNHIDKYFDKSEEEAMSLPGRARRTHDWWVESLDTLISDHKNYVKHLEHIRDNNGMMLDEDGLPVAFYYPTKSYSGAHFATYNPDMIEPIIKAGTSEKGVCPECGNPWARVVERTIGEAKLTPKTTASHHARGGEGIPTGTVGKAGSSRIDATSTTTGWRATCEHVQLRSNLTIKEKEYVESELAKHHSQ